MVKARASRANGVKLIQVETMAEPLDPPVPHFASLSFLAARVKTRVCPPLFAFSFFLKQFGKKSDAVAVASKARVGKLGGRGQNVPKGDPRGEWR